MSDQSSCCTPVRAGASPGTVTSLPPVTAPATARQLRGMRLLPGGTFLMGSDRGTYPEDGEGPVREIELRPFYMDVCAVSNHLFDKFVRDTRYETEAERFGWSFVFHLLVPPDMAAKVKKTAEAVPWWYKVPGAYWRHPEGRGTHLKGREDHPVVHVSWNDAVTYCAWAGKRLPTEAEFEYATRGGLEQKLYPWGDELSPNGKHQCNTWQGIFPNMNSAEDGYVGTAPVRSFPPNGFGLFNIVGNVWEWCSDWFSRDFHVSGPRANPVGPPAGTAKVIRGGSYLCHESYCNRYRCSARTSNTPESSTGNLGFRCVVDSN
ncbi:MAG: formylglycine-generating enzyme family protein [Candidatus Hydrogenedentes bacterium]|nr:formylglycine-generating enzyme family protein [Candidatus Hydrogenedentota bacterium]